MACPGYRSGCLAARSWVNPPEWVSISSDLATVVAVLVAAAGLIYTGKQLELERKAMGAQLLLQIDETLREFDSTIFGLRDGSLQGDEIEVQRLMGAMERLHVLVTKKLVDAGEIDDLHGWRLQELLNNERVRTYLNQYPTEWRRLTDLDRLLSDHRTRATRSMDRTIRKR
jgi:hypothetical protein